MRAACFGCLVVVGVMCAVAQSPQGYHRFPAIHGETILFTSEGDLWRVPVAGGMAHRLTTHPGTESHAAISPDGERVAFSAEYEGPTEVYSMPLGGGLPARHTFEGATARVVGWTPAGNILYTTRAYSTLPDYQLVQINPKTGRRDLIPLAQASDGVFDPETHALFFTRLPKQSSSTKRYRGGWIEHLWKFVPGEPEAVPLTADFPGTSRNPMWWQERLHFVSDRDGVMNLWTMKPDGSDLKQLTRHTDWDVKSAALHNGRIVYQHGADLRLYDIARETDTPLRIGLASDFDQMRERWVKKPLDFLTAAHLSSNGDRVALTARGRVFVAPVEQGRFVEATRQPGVRYRQARFLADGKTLIALSDETGELEFWTLPANGLGKPSQLTTDGTVYRFAGLPSPNGQWLAWADKDLKLWVMPIKKPPPRQIAASQMRGFEDLAWAPDSQWLAYVQMAPNTYKQIHLYRVTDGMRATVTSDRVDSYSPAWSPDGQWLYFLSDRELRSLVQSPWGPRQPDPFFTDTTKIYHVALTKGLRSPFAPRNELQTERPATKTTETSEAAPPDTERKPADAKPTVPAKPAVKVVVDSDGLMARVEEVPVPAGNYENLAVTAKNLLWVDRGLGFDAKRKLQQLEITAKSPKPKTLVEDFREYELSADGRKLLIRKGDVFYVIAADAPAPAKLEDKVNLDGWTFSVVPREEWRQIFTESWRMIRDYFYDRNLHGVDWPAILKKYLPLVDRVSDRGELSDVVAEMVGELSALHIYVRYGELREGPDQIKTASLGARLTRDEPAGGWRVEHVYRTDPDYPKRLAPLRRPDVAVQAGDVLLSVNGAPTLSVEHPERLLRNQAGRQTLLEVKSPGQEKARSVVVHPITAEQEADLRYDEWEYTRRQQVERLGQGKIGYVHLRAMGAANIAEWARDFYPVFNRQGLILDVRHNRGGNIDSWILSKLLRQAWFYWQPRVGRPYWNMQYAFRGHMVVLCNAHTASDGEAFTEGFRRLGLGTVIGTRTWGGEIWLSARRWLVDNGMATAAETGVYGPEGEWLIEGHGVDPDIVVDNLPHATFQGRDAQLEAAVQHLLALIEKDPRPVPPPPRHPDKSFPR